MHTKKNVTVANVRTIGISAAAISVSRIGKRTPALTPDPV